MDPGRLTLVAREAVVEVLALGRLVPLLRVGLLLATAVAAGARRAAAVAHGLAAVAGGRLGLGAAVARLLARTAVRTYGGVSKRAPRSNSIVGIPTAVLVEIGRGRAGIAGRLGALGAVLLVGVELLRLVRGLVLAPLSRVSIAVEAQGEE